MVILKKFETNLDKDAVINNKRTILGIRQSYISKLVTTKKDRYEPIPLHIIICRLNHR